MELIDPESLSETVDAANEALFYGRALTSAAREKVAAWIAARRTELARWAPARI